MALEAQAEAASRSRERRASRDQHLEPGVALAAHRAGMARVLARRRSGRSESGGPRPVGWTAWVAPGFFALALGSKEIAAGAAPLFAWLAWRQGGPLRAPRSGLFVALALAAVVPWMGHRASTD